MVLFWPEKGCTHRLFLMDGFVMVGDFQMVDNKLRITINLKCDQEKAPSAYVCKSPGEYF